MKTPIKDFSNSYLSFICVLLFAFFALALLPESIYAQEITEVVYLKNGDILRGVIVEEIPFESIKMELPGGSTITVKYSDIAKITKERPSTKREAIHQTQPPKTKEVQPQQLADHKDAASNFRKSSLLLSIPFFAPTGTDIENYAYVGIKGGLSVQMEPRQIWGIFAEYKISRLEMIYSTYREDITIGMLSIGAGFKYLFLDEKIYLGTEAFYSNIHLESESYNGFGFALKIGGGGYVSPVLYLFIEAKFNEINYVDDQGLEGLGLELGMHYYVN